MIKSENQKHEKGGLLSNFLIFEILEKQNVIF